MCGWDADPVQVEVVSAPGLTAGAAFSFTTDTVLDMDVVTDPLAES